MRRVIAFTWLLLLPASGAAQDGARPVSLAPRGSLATETDVAVARLCDDAGRHVRAGLLTEAPAAWELYRRAADLAREALAVDPSALEPRYWLAASLGLLTSSANWHERLKLGREVHRLAGEVLAADSTHAGANHVMGRLHAEAMRMNGFVRFLAGRILGQDMIRRASWQEAERFLVRAAELEPERAIHRLELARLYLDTRRAEEAALNVDAALRLAAADPLAPLVERQAAALRAQLADP